MIMSSRVGVEKILYVCRDGHTMNQRADKKSPKVCSGKVLDKKTSLMVACPNPVFDPESAQAGKDALDTPKKKRVAKKK